MKKPRAPYSHKPPPGEVEVEAKVAASETIRAVRVIIGKPKPHETDATVTPVLPRPGSKPSRRGRTT